MGPGDKLSQNQRARGEQRRKWAGACLISEQELRMWDGSPATIACPRGDIHPLVEQEARLALCSLISRSQSIYPFTSRK